MEIDDSLFFQDPIPDPGSLQTMVGPEALHACRSRRLAVGENLYLTDGKGMVARARIEDRSPRCDSLTVMIEETVVNPAPSPRLVLASAIPKGDRQSVMLGMAVQLGMNDYIPLECDRSATRYSDRMNHRWRKVVLESMKQCRQTHMPAIRDARTLEHLLDVSREPVEKRSRVLIVGDPQGDCADVDDCADWARLEEIVLIVGPEGGFSSAEKQLLKREKVLKLRLSDRILRTETAAISLCSAVYQYFFAKR